MKKFLLKVLQLFIFPNIFSFVDNIMLKNKYFKKEGIKNLWEQQYVVLESFSESIYDGQDIAIKGGNGVGKTLLCIICALFTCLTGTHKNIVMLNSLDKYREETYNIITDIIKNSFILSMFFNVVGGRTVNIKCINGSEIFFMTQTDSKIKTETLDSFCVIVDNASGIMLNSVFAAIEKLTKSVNSFMFLIGTPYNNKGYFYDAFNKNSKTFNTGTIKSCYIDDVKIQKFIRGSVRNFGEDSNFCRTRIFAEFPEQEKSKEV